MGFYNNVHNIPTLEVPKNGCMIQIPQGLYKVTIDDKPSIVSVESRVHVNKELASSADFCQECILNKSYKDIRNTDRYRIRCYDIVCSADERDDEEYVVMRKVEDVSMIK